MSRPQHVVLDEDDLFFTQPLYAYVGEDVELPDAEAIEEGFVIISETAAHLTLMRFFSEEDGYVH